MSPRWHGAVREGLVCGSMGAALSTLALFLLGQRQGAAAGPINAVSHWAWGEEALKADAPTLRHTGIGLLTQHLASVFWATLYAALVGHLRRSKEPAAALLGGAATSATAYVIDYTVTPSRLTPGYEHRLDGRGMLAVYTALALGFAAGAVMLRGR